MFEEHCDLFEQNNTLIFMGYVLILKVYYRMLEIPVFSDSVTFWCNQPEPFQQLW